MEVEKLQEDERNTSDDKPGITLDGAEFLDKVRVENCFPTSKFHDYLREQNKGSLTALDFRGLDQVTDEVFLVLFHSSEGSDVLQHVRLARFEGCVHITDMGVAYLAMACPQLVKVYLDGCPHLTELSLSILHQHCNQLKVVSMIATSVTCLHPDLQNLDLRLNGCPMINSASEWKTASYAWPKVVEKSLVVVGKDSTHFSILDFLCLGQINRVDYNHMAYKSDIMLPGISSVVFNGFECHTKIAMVSPFIRRQALYIIPVDLENPEIESVSLYITGRLNAIRGQAPTAPVIVLCHHGNNETTAMTKRATEVSKNLVDILHMQQEDIKKAAEFDSYQSPAAVERGFLCQQRWMRCVPFLEKTNNEGFCFVQLNTDSKQSKLHWPHIDTIHRDLQRRVQELERRNKDLLGKIQKTFLLKIEKVKKIDAKSLEMLAEMTDPPAVIMKLIGPLKVLFKLKSQTWAEVKTFLSDTNCVNNFANFKPMDMPQEMLEDLKVYMSDEELDSDLINHLGQVSSAALMIWQWIQAIYVCGIYQSKRLSHIDEINEIMKFLNPVSDESSSVPSEHDNLDKRNQVELDLREMERKAQDFLDQRLEPAFDDLRSLSKADIVEIRSFKNPPTIVQSVINCVQILLLPKVSKNDLTWKNAKSMMSDFAFVRKLLEYDKDNVTTQRLQMLKPYIDDPDLSPAKIKNVSSAASAMWNWVTVVYEYSNIRQKLTILQFTKEQARKIPKSKEQAAVFQTEKDLKEEEQKLVQFHANYMEPGNENLRNLNKSDISELKSFAKPPAVVQSVMECIQILLRPKITKIMDAGSTVVCLTTEFYWTHAIQYKSKMDDLSWKNSKVIMADSSFLRSLLDYDKENVTSKQMKMLKPYINDPSLSSDSLKKVSTAASSMWDWVTAVYHYSNIYQRVIILRKAKVTQEKIIAENKQLLPEETEALNFAVKYMNWLGMLDVAMRIEHRNYESPGLYMSPSFQQYAKKVTGRKSERLWCSPGMSTTEQAMLHKLHDMGKVLYFPEVPGKPVIADVEWFLQLLQTLQCAKKNDKLYNNDRVRAIGQGTPLFTSADVLEVWKAQAKEDQAEKVLLILKHQGIVIDIPNNCVQNLPEPDEESGELMFLFTHLHDKAYTRTALDAGLHSNLHVRENYWSDAGSENSNSTDVQVHYSYKFTAGIPAALLPQVIAEALKVASVRRIWRWGITLAMGAVEVQIKHNVHGTMMSSSFDVQGRTTQFGSDSPLHLVQQYLWSVVNNFILIIDYYAHQFLHLYMKIRQPCLGSCSKSGFPHTYSLTELKPEVGLTLPCPKCGKQGMSKEIVGFLTGFQPFLPFHDFRPDAPSVPVNMTGPYSKWTKVNEDNPETTRHCKHCGISKEMSMRQWHMRCSVTPAFSSLCLEPTEELDTGWKPQRGSLLMGPPCKSRTEQADSEKSNSVTLKCGTIYGITDIFIKVLEPGASKIMLTTRHYHTQKDSEEAQQHGPTAVLDLQAGIFGQRVDKDEITEVKDAKFCFHAGDVLHMTILREKLVEKDGIQNLKFDVCFLKNGEELVTLEIPFDETFFAVCLDANKHGGQRARLIFQCPPYPMITGEHFPLNSALVYKSAIGTQWMLGRVQAVVDGQILVVPATQGPDQQNSRMFTPDSLDIQPVNAFSNGLSVTIGRDLVRSKEQLVQHLLSNKLWPAPVALFAGHIKKGTQYAYFDIRRFNPKMCTVNVNSPQVLEQNSILGSSWRSSDEPRQLQSLATLLLPSGITTEQLLNPSRQLAHKWDKQALHPLCGGNIIGRIEQGQQVFSGDVHLINLPELLLDGEESYKILHGHNKHMLHVSSAFLRNQIPCMPASWQNSFPHVDSSFPKEQVLLCVKAWVELYRSTYMFWHILGLYLENTRGGGHSNWKNNPFRQKFLSLTDREDVKNTLIISRNKQHFSCASHNTLAFTPNFFQSKVAGDFANCVTHIEITSGKIKELPHDLFGFYLNQLNNLQALQISGCPLGSLEEINRCKNLKFLSVPNTGLTEIHSNLAVLRSSLTHLHVARNPIQHLPDFLTSMGCLKSLNVSYTLIEMLPKNIGDLRQLRRLLLRSTRVTKLPPSFVKLKNLETLEVTGIPWVYHHSHNAVLFTEKKWMTWCRDHNINGLMDTKTQKDVFDKHDFIRDGSLNTEEIESLNEDLFQRFPRLTCDSNDQFGGMPAEIFSCRNLRELSLTHQGIQFVPDRIGQLRRLEYLSLDDNPKLEVISGKLGNANIKVLGIKRCSMLKTPPKEIVNQGMKTVIAFLKRLSQGSVTCYRTKLMFVGLGGAGKTSLMRALMSPDFRAPKTEGEAITDGIDISLWTLKRSGKALTYSVWDFAGQSVYYNTHQFFLSQRAVYMLIWNTRLGYEHSGLDFWLSSIACHCPKAPVFVIGTHADKISKSDLPREKLKSRFPNISAFATISSYTGLGVSDLLEELVKVTLEQPYLGEEIPKAWLNFERAVLGLRTKASLMTWKELCTLAQNAGIYSNEIQQAVQFLHELGALQHFDNELLRDRVIINPQWVVDVMACVVTVHNKVIVDGHLKHSDIGKVWADYSANLHSWMLQLTEAFDLTFPLPDRPENIVPCLLPQKEPQYVWPSVEEELGWRETIIIYKFEYLPAGLFNRAQVRLYQFSDSSKMWKTGSVLTKNGHMAKLVQTSETNVSVHVIGPRPENVQLLIHEVFEGLISDFFRGVKYEYQMPCAECMEVHIKEPTMFSSLVLRRAIEMKALFLQCHAMFHTLSIQDVQSSLPPQSTTDYDLQLQHTIRDLKSLEDDLESDVFFMYCESDIPKNENMGKTVDPLEIKQALEDEGFKCCFSNSLASRKVEDLALAIKNSQIVLVLISDSFVEDTHCQRMFHYMKDTLRKDFFLLMVGSGRSWQKSEIGMLVTDKVFINFQRVNQYQEKIKELSRKLQTKVKKEQSTGLPDPDVFISYAWVNSASAVAQGHAKPRDGSLGHGDPRELKRFLEKELKVNCWLDVERTGQMGLFEDIADGMKKSKVVVACVSDEYVMSSNCQMEFRFAHVALRRPIILALVGTGLQWESTEIGMLSLGYPRVNFLVANNTARNKLVTLIQEHLQNGPQAGVVERPISANLSGQKQQAFQELYELAQRKFLRQIAGYIEQNDNYPRLFIADLNYDPNQEEHEQLGSAEAAEVSIALEPEKDKSQPSFVFDDLLAGQFCIKILCEHEGGWHSVDDGFPVELSGSDLVSLWQLSAPYMGRVLAILKHSNINLHIVSTAEGNKLVRSLEDRVGVEGQLEVRPFYMALRTYIMNKDRQNRKGNLTRCYMPSGKILWLCEEHSQLPRVTKLPDSDINMADVTGEDVEGRSPEMQLLSDLREIRSAGDKPVDSPDITKTVAMEICNPLDRPPKDTKILTKTNATPPETVNLGSTGTNKRTGSTTSDRQSSKQSKRPSRPVSTEEKVKIAGSVIASGGVGNLGPNSRACAIL